MPEGGDPTNSSASESRSQPDSPCDTWKKYCQSYRGFWKILTEHPELINNHEVVESARTIQRTCPFINFGCVDELLHTMREMAGEQLYASKKEERKKHLEDMIDRLRTETNLGYELNTIFLEYQFLGKHEQTEDQKQCSKEVVETNNAYRKSLQDKNSDHLNPVEAQELRHCQPLLLDYDILRIFVHYVKIYLCLYCSYSKEQGSSESLGILCKLTEAAFSKERTKSVIQVVVDFLQCFKKCKDIQPLQYKQLCAQIRWPLLSPGTSYGERKAQVIEVMKLLKTLLETIPDRTANYTGVLLPPMYFLNGEGAVTNEYAKNKSKEDQKCSNWELQEPPVLPSHFTERSSHFQNIKTIIHTTPYDDVNPTTYSSWLYYFIMHDPLLHPDCADQGYIGITGERLTGKWNDHQDKASKVYDEPDTTHSFTLVDCCLALQQMYSDLTGAEQCAGIFVIGCTENNGEEASVLSDATPQRLSSPDDTMKRGEREKQLCIEYQLTDMKKGMNMYTWVVPNAV